MKVTKIIDDSSSFTFMLPNRGENKRPNDLHVHALVLNLNNAAKYAHATFSQIDENSFTMTCDEGYTFRDDVTWGHVSTNNPLLGTAVAVYLNIGTGSWSKEDWNNNVPNIQFGYNHGGNDNIMFELGCWKKPTI